LANLVQELVSGRHRAPQRLQLEVLGEHVIARCRRRGPAGGPLAFEIALGVDDRIQIAAHHRAEDRIAQLRFDVEVPVSVQEEDLHSSIRSISRSG
jgi:hypothetical protein